MRITESQLRKIVRQEARRLSEAPLPRGLSRRKPALHSYTLYLPETEIDGVVETAELEGCQMFSAQPTGENVEDYATGDVVKEYAVEIHGSLVALEKFYYALSEGETAQSTEAFDAAELGIHRV